MVADIIFSLAALKGLSNSKGEIWRVHPSQLYCFEITVSFCIYLPHHVHVVRMGKAVP